MEPDRRAMLLEALVLPWLIRCSFRVAGVPVTQARLRRWSERGRARPEPGGVMAYARWSQGMARRVVGVGGTCLVRSLTLWAMLKRRGVEVDLQVGVRKQDGRFEGHAWIEYEGKPVNDDPDLIATYTPYKEPLSFDPAFWPK